MKPIGHRPIFVWFSDESNHKECSAFEEFDSEPDALNWIASTARAHNAKLSEFVAIVDGKRRKVSPLKEVLTVKFE